MTSRRRDLLVVDVLRAGVRIRMQPMKPRDGWMLEGVAVVARRGLGLAILRKYARKDG